MHCLVNSRECLGAPTNPHRESRRAHDKTNDNSCEAGLGGGTFSFTLEKLSTKICPTGTNKAQIKSSQIIEAGCETQPDYVGHGQTSPSSTAPGHYWEFDNTPFRLYWYKHRVSNPRNRRYSSSTRPWGLSKIRLVSGIRLCVLAWWKHLAAFPRT